MSIDTNKHAGKYNEWKDIYSWDTCKTNRREYGEFLCSFLTSSDQSLVVNMNGSWGTGKTELLRRLYVSLAEKRHAVVYIDAWESDFSNDALAVVCSELITQLDTIFDKRNQKAKKNIRSLKKLMSIWLMLTQGVALAAGNAEAVGSLEGVKQVSNTLPDSMGKSVSEANMELIDSVQSDHNARLTAMREIKKHVSFLAELMHSLYGLKKQIIILVDELDRCRPSYALEMLEVIKHFFQSKGCVFLIATDTNALQHSIKAVYGSDFNAEEYLKRFFDRRIVLPKVPTLNYLNFKELSLEKYSERINFTSFGGDIDSHNQIFSELFTECDMTLRDIEQSLQKFFSSLDFLLNSVGEKKIAINGVVLMAGIIEEMKGSNDFFERNVMSSPEFNLLSGGILLTIIRLHFAHVLKCKSKLIMTNTGRWVEQYRDNEVLTICSNPQYGNSTTSISSTIDYLKVFQLYEDEMTNYWLWEDYRRIIELSGHIE